MENSKIKRVLVLGCISIIGLVLTQSYWLIKNWDLKDFEFDESVHIVLTNVAHNLARVGGFELPKQGLIQRKSSNYYAVNVNGQIDAAILEDFLYRELEHSNLKFDFEYAVYDCFSEELKYGNYCRFDDNHPEEINTERFQKFEDLVYYFVIRFPDRESFLLGNMKTQMSFALIAILSILFFTYSLLIIFRQKRLSDLQRDFISNMTHEFKTPISSINIASEMIGRNKVFKENEKLNTYLTIIQEQNRRLNDQVERILNTVNLENKDFKYDMREFDIVDLLREITAAEKIKNGAEIDIEFSNETGLSEVIVIGDVLHIRNIAYNLLDNAIKYCDKKPHIKIRLNKDKSNIIWSAEDNGIGIKQESLKNIFDKFYRENTSNIHNVKGIGLGLYYVKKICDVHQWKIDVTSKLGVGTCFRITLKEKICN